MMTKGECSLKEISGDDAYDYEIGSYLVEVNGNSLNVEFNSNGNGLILNWNIFGPIFAIIGAIILVGVFRKMNESSRLEKN